LTGPWTYFNGSKLVPKLLADDILKDHHFITNRTSWAIYHYLDGYYQPGGEATIRELCREKLGELAKRGDLSEVVEQIRDTTFRMPEDFNSAPYLVCVENGILDTKTRELAPHTPDRIFLQKLPAKYNPKATCPTVMKRLLEWTDKDGLITIIQFAGFCLHRNYFIRKAVIIHGEGENGKTTLTLFLTGWLGEDNVAAVKIQNLDKRFTGIRLLGKLANICDDLPADAWFSTGFFKELTGGSQIEVEQKFKDGFLTRNYAKVLYTANRLPLVSDDSKAFWDRITIIPFEAKFTTTTSREEIVAGMLIEDERSGFLNLALDGLEMLRAQNRFYGDDDNETTKRKYIKLSDPIMAFGHDRTIESPLNRILKSELYGAYVDYCTENGYPVKESNAFSKSFKRLYPRLEDCQITGEDGRQRHAWVGIDLVSEETRILPEATSPNTQATRGFRLFKSLEQNYDIIVNRGNKPVEPVELVYGKKELPAVADGSNPKCSYLYEVAAAIPYICVAADPTDDAKTISIGPCETGQIIALPSQIACQWEEKGLVKKLSGEEK
jgi:putative DNA primase/helicase